MDALLKSSPIRLRASPLKSETSQLYLHQLQKQQYTGHARTNLEHVSQLDIDHESPFIRQTTLVCTLGELWNTREEIAAMIKIGMNILRLNLSMGTHEFYREAIETVRSIEAASNYRPPVAIAVDISPPTVRTGLINCDADAEVTLITGQHVTLTVDEAFRDATSDSLIYLDCQYFQQFIECVVPGDSIYLDDGMLTLMVEVVTKDNIKCVIKQGGPLGSWKRVDLLTEKVYQKAFDTSYERDLEFAKQSKVDFVFTGYALSHDQLVRAKNTLGEEILLFAKVETKESLLNLCEIMDVADGIIVGRNGLGLVYPTEKVFLLQKQIIAKCNIMHKPVFVISQLLESMRFKPRPTRAEAGDIANAVLDGADGLILTVETSRGIYPREALRVLHKTCREAESTMFHDRFCMDLKIARDLRGLSPMGPAYLAGLAAVQAAYSSNASAIFVVTTTGSSASAIAAFRPSCPVIAIMRRPKVARLTHAFRGLHPFVFIGEKMKEWSIDMDNRLNAAIDYCRTRGFVSGGDQVVIVTGSSAGSGETNTVRVFEVPRDAKPLTIVNSQSQLHNGGQ